MVNLSDREILYSVLGGLQPGGTCLSWITGLTAFEALRLTQRFDPNTPWAYRLMVYFSLLMSFAIAGMFASVLYHYCVESYGNYRKLLEVTTVLKYHYVLSKIATIGGFIFYAYIVYNSEVGASKLWKIPVIKISAVLVVGGLCAVLSDGITQMLVLNDFKTIGEHLSFWRWGPAVQAACGVVLTFLKACDLANRNSIKQIVALKNNRFQCGATVLCLLSQTALFPTLFDLVQVSLHHGKGAGVGYTLLSLSAELHLLGPIMAISAMIQDNIAAESTCSNAKNDTKGLNSTSNQLLAFRKETSDL